jgi:hypothetical protein
MPAARAPFAAEADRLRRVADQAAAEFGGLPLPPGSWVSLAGGALLEVDEGGPLAGRTVDLLGLLGRLEATEAALAAWAARAGPGPTDLTGVARGLGIAAPSAPALARLRAGLALLSHPGPGGELLRLRDPAAWPVPAPLALLAVAGLGRTGHHHPGERPLSVAPERAAAALLARLTRLEPAALRDPRRSLPGVRLALLAAWGTACPSGDDGYSRFAIEAAACDAALGIASPRADRRGAARARALDELVALDPAFAGSGLAGGRWRLVRRSR